MEKVLTYDNFDEVTGSGVCLVDFWATWCGPCRMLAPTIEQIADEYEGRAVVGKVDVDEYPQLAERFGIASIPAVFLFKDGKAVGNLIGYHLNREYEALLDGALNEG